MQNQKQKQRGQKIFIIGVGMTKFLRPSPSNPQQTQLAQIAIRRALYDSKLNYSSIKAAIGGYIFSQATSAQNAVYRIGMTGIPVYNINNNGATGSSTVHLGYNLIKGGTYDCILCFGFDKMDIGALKLTKPIQKIYQRGLQINGKQAYNQAIAVSGFGNAGLEHMKKYGTKEECFINIAVKNHRNGAKNQYAQYQKGYGYEKIKNSLKIHKLLTLYQCSPTSDGAAAVIICNENFIKQHKLQNQSVQILSSIMTTDTQKMYENNIQLCGYSMTKRAAQKVYKQIKINPKDIQIIQLHDCFSTNQLITYQALGLCQQGKGGQFVEKKLNDYGGQVVINPSGGLLSRGHPIGATGVSQFVELVWQLRGIAGERQVRNQKTTKLPKYGLQHGIGLGGACVVSLLQKYNENISQGVSSLRIIEEREKLQKNKNVGIIRPKL